MTRIPRPAIPLAVRIQVIERQLHQAGIAFNENPHIRGTKRLKALLWILFGEDGARAECDHRPPLALRAYDPSVPNVAARFTPNANDPDYLEYVLEEEHLNRTAGKGGDKMRFGGDIRQITKGKNLRKRPDLWRVRERGEPAPKLPKPKPKNARRYAWPKGRKIQSRGFRR